MTLNPQTLPPPPLLQPLFCSLSSFSSTYTQIKHLHLPFGCLFFFFLFHVFCLFRFPVASAAIHRRSSSFHMSLSPFIALHFYCRVSVSNFHPFTLSFFSSFSLLLLTPLFFSLLRPSRWLVFVSLSLVAAAGSGLNNEITFAVGREAAHQTSSPVTLPANTHARVTPESVRTNPSHLHLGINICHTYARANKLYISRQMHGNRWSSETHARAHSQSLVLISCAHRPALRAECSRMEVNVLITPAATREAHFVPLNRDEERRLLPTESSKEQQMQKERTKCLTRNPSTPPPFFLVPAKIIA